MASTIVETLVCNYRNSTSTFVIKNRFDFNNNIVKCLQCKVFTITKFIWAIVQYNYFL